MQAPKQLTSRSFAQNANQEAKRAHVVKIDDTEAEPFWLTLKLRSRETGSMKSRNLDLSCVRCEEGAELTLEEGVLL